MKLDTYLFYDKEWNQIDEQDWPNVENAVFIVKKSNRAVETDKEYSVLQWRTEEHEFVHGLGDFWQLEDAKLFAQAKVDLINKEA